LKKDRIFSASVLHPFFSKKGTSTANEDLEEAINLTKALNIDVLWAEKIKIHHTVPSSIFGMGNIQRLKNIIHEKNINLVIINTAVTASQQRNLERIWKCKVFDRTGLILSIFAARARTKEGIIQVELAALTYQKSRLVKSWTHLERQRGGLSFVGGPGESQLELDRRLLETRIKKLKKQLEKVDETRGLQRRSRQKVPYPIISLVGYTNAGKSTLFNRLTGSTVYVKDQLFSTLDPTMRLIRLPSGRKAILSDTVGFISNIPTQLIASFKSTLQDVSESSILLHLIDVTATNSEKQYQDVQKILADININPKDTCIIDVYNKVDTHGEKYSTSSKDQVLISAVTGYGCLKLLNLIDTALEKMEETFSVTLPSFSSKPAAWLHENATVSHCKTTNTTLSLQGYISKKNKGLFRKFFFGIKIL